MKDRSRTARRLRNATAIIGVSGALIAGGTGIARASQEAPLYQAATLDQSQTASFSTWFIGRTIVNFKDNSSQVTRYQWSSGPSKGSGVLQPGQGSSIDRAFVGLPVSVTDEGPGSLFVSLPAP